MMRPVWTTRGRRSSSTPATAQRATSTGHMTLRLVTTPECVSLSHGIVQRLYVTQACSQTKIPEGAKPSREENIKRKSIAWAPRYSNPIFSAFAGIVV